MMFQVDRAEQQCNRTSRCTGGRNNRRKVWCDRKFRSLKRLQSVVLDICVRYIRWIVDNDESGAVTIALALPFRSVMP